MSKKKNKQLSKTEDNQITEMRAESFSGPLPPPAILEQYDAVYPGAAEVIIKGFEKQTNHRISIERSVVKTSNFKEMLGLVFGFTIAMTTILGGIYTVLQGYTFLGGGLSFAGLAVLVGAFIVTSQSKKKD